MQNLNLRASGGGASFADPANWFDGFDWRGGSMADGSYPPPPSPGVVTAVIAAFSAILSAGVVWLGQRLIGHAAFQTALNDGFAKISTALERRAESLEIELAATRKERAELRDTLERERVQTGAERAALRGEIANLSQSLESLKQWLRANDIAIPSHRPPYSADAPPPAMIVLADRDPFGPPSDS